MLNVRLMRRRHLVFVLAFLDVEILAVDDEVRSDHEQIALQIRHPGAQLVFEVSQLDRHGDVLGNAVQGECPGDVGGGDVAVGLHVGE